MGSVWGWTHMSRGTLDTLMPTNAYPVRGVGGLDETLQVKHTVLCSQHAWIW